MKLITILTVTAFFVAFLTPETKTKNYDNGQLQYQVDIENGMFNGQCTFWFENGQIKTQGTFKNNQRTGTWTVWDSSGNLRMTREYKNNFQFEITTVKNCKGENITFPEKTIYNLSKNQDGYIEYPTILEMDILISRRIWRTIKSSETNKLFFNDNRLFNLIFKNITDSKKLIAYDPSSEEFEKELTITDVKSKVTEGADEVIGFKIKEDWFFNSNKQLSEVRIIGLCPIIKSQDKGQVSELFWIYFPELRKLMAMEQVDIKGAASIKTMDDIFYFRHFSSNIYKESNIYHLEIADYKSGDEIQEEAEQIEMTLLDIEHNIWIGQTEKK